MLAQVCKLKPEEFIHTLGDAHLYLNHLEQADKQLARTPGLPPRVELNERVTSIFDFTYDDIQFVNYEPQANIPAPVAV